MTSILTVIGTEDAHRLEEAKERRGTATYIRVSKRESLQEIKNRYGLRLRAYERQL